MKFVVYGMLVLLTVLHQSYRFVTGDRLLLGFLPEELAWQAGVSLGAAATWLVAALYAWPADDDYSPAGVPAPVLAAAATLPDSDETTDDGAEAGQ